MNIKRKIGFWKWLVKITISIFKGMPMFLYSLVILVETELFFGVIFGIFGTMIVSSRFGDLVGALMGIGCLLLTLHSIYRMSQEE